MMQPNLRVPPTTQPYRAAYEFDSSGNAVMSSAANWTLVLAIISFVSAAGNLIGKSWGACISEIVFGILFIVVSSSFRNVVQTRGNDVDHLLKALKMFSVIFTLRMVFLAIGGFLLVLALFLSGGP